MDVNFTVGVSAVSLLLLLNGVATGIKLMRDKTGNASLIEAVKELRKGLTAMAEAQRTVVRDVSKLQQDHKDFVSCFQKLETGAAERAVYLKGIWDELKALNRKRG